MQKSGIKFLRILPRTIVPLDSAVIFVLYAIYYTAHSHFRQYVFLSEYGMHKTVDSRLNLPTKIFNFCGARSGKQRF